MSGFRDLQGTAARALVAFLDEHPVRPATRWSPDDDGVLRGTVYGPQAGGVQAVDWYAEALGGTPVRLHTFEFDGMLLCVVEVTAVWRDVRVVVQVQVPVRPVLVPTRLRTGDGAVLAPADVAVAS
jgi:hypothetical protein